MPEASWKDPYGAFNFKITAGDQLFGHFTECSGISIDVATVEYREGGQAAVVHQVPTITTYHDISLKYGLTESTQLWTWFLATAQGRVDRRNVSIVLLDAAGTAPVLEWDLIGAFPKRWVGPELRASARAGAVEEIVLAYDRLGRPE